MASITRRLKRLRSRERILRANLLGPSQSWGAPPSDEEYDRALAYRVLMHAEIERYLEDTVLSALLSSQEIFRNLNRRITHPASSALSHYRSKCFLEGKDGAEPAFLDSNTLATYALSKLEDAVKWIEISIVANNNGIKPANIRKLMGWIGIDSSDLDPNLLYALKRLGTERGDAAHLSRREIWRRYKRKVVPAGAPKIRRLPSPSDEVAAVDAVLKLLAQLDRLVQARLRTTS
ncbi:HEPN domain-containing protein [Streptomyces sp. NPDC019937]|uniref:HEPN domain-containing protein n=1 Tax=Streptomyces sp. NPDC019937 TaxID=3154787 RepID=UPI0033D48932